MLHSVSPFAAIVAEAEKIQADLIVMGRYGRTGLSRLLMGSVTARVIGHSPINVLVVPQGASLGFARLLIASDGSPYSDAALTEALAMAGRAGAASSSAWRWPGRKARSSRPRRSSTGC